jgi:hypothetical protein
MKYFSVVAKFAALLLTLAFPAIAAAPIIIISPFTGEIIPEGPDTCPFNVSVVPEAGRPNNGKIILFANSAILHGAAFVTATNLTTNKSINLQFSGPEHFSFVDNTITVTGPDLSFLSPNVLPPNLPPVLYAQGGRLVVQFDKAGNIVSVSFNGTVQNLCELLE